MMDYRLFLDDYRDPPSEGVWMVARSYQDFVRCITECGIPAFVSFDHDMADEHYAHHTHPIPYTSYAHPTGYDCAKWLIEHCKAISAPRPDFIVHSLNPAGRENIERVMKA
ncbi:hypothetical protein Q1W73_16665 [Asticcacaulis sp. ZE23SCel15]|uniref:cyclic-phosphate processing receiver domain-containing protein n=1 Tax=Asticcacaulis sp. ZE23SCel15 TaxID=3059027 RepID=UPI00265D680B|nr:cyclic-phosphate processing receiver domain-containing protein [Asticcacaulis sp. ZE23SCel15]WKL57277.1 hypothetical protein Q1W73_16665 [Asticcacaulis sp. ZE23SCel15]